MIDPKRIEQIPMIREHASRLICLANDIVSSRHGPYQGKDFLGAMADAFMHKQIDNLKSICILVDNGQNPDALIIARSAYENMALLLWAAHGPDTSLRETRPLKWFAYEYIEGYRQIIQNKNRDADIASGAKTAIYRGVQEYADIFLTNKAEEDLRQGKTLSIDPFIKGWPSENLSDRVDELKKKGYIDQNAYQLYQILSQWLHGTPQGMGMVFRHDGNCFLQDEYTCKYLGGCAIHIGIQSLANTAVLFNNHLRLDFTDRLNELKNKYNELSIVTSQRYCKPGKSNTPRQHETV